MLSSFRLLLRYCSGKQVLSLVFATALMSVQCTTYHVMLGGVSHHFTREFRGRPYNEIHHTVGFGLRSESPIPLAGFANDMCLYDFCLYQVLLPSYDGMSGLVFVGAKYDFRL